MCLGALLTHSQEYRGIILLSSPLFVEQKDGWASNTIKAAAIEEMFKLLFAREEAAVQLASALEHLKKHVGLEVRPAWFG